MSNDISRNDIGEPLDQYQTRGNENMYTLGSLVQKAARRGNRELACWAAWELVRSGYDGFFWSRAASTILLEDLRLRPEEAHLLTAIERLRVMSNTVFEDDEGMKQAAAMRAASLLAEAESSRELLPMMGWWNEIAEERLKAIKNGEEPEHPFPIDEVRNDIEYVVNDQHTAKGSRAGRNHAHYLIEASRTTDPTELEEEYKRRLLKHGVSYDVTDEQVDHATEPVPEDEPWEHDRRISFPRH